MKLHLMKKNSLPVKMMLMAIKLGINVITRSDYYKTMTGKRMTVSVLKKSEYRTVEKNDRGEWIVTKIGYPKNYQVVIIWEGNKSKYDDKGNLLR